MVWNALIAFSVVGNLFTSPVNMNFTYDSTGLFVNGADGGDTAGREGDFWFYNGIVNGPDQSGEFSRVLNLLQVSSGVYVRNPNQPQYNIPSDFSRDQTIPLILAMGANKQYGTLRQLLWTQIKHLGFYQNWDMPGPADVSSYIRAFNAWYLYPILLFTDFAFVVESLIRVEATLGDTSDDINHTLQLLQAQYKFPTPVSLLARKIYKKYRNIQQAWDGYFSPNSCKFNELYSPLISKM